MKRTIALVLALLISLSGLQVYAAGLYEEFGPTNKWTDAQWDQALSEWSDADWETYYAEEELQRIPALQKELGMTNIGGANLNIGEKYVDFGAMLPEYVGGRTMIALQTIEKPLGLSISQSGSSVAVTGAYSKLTFTIGEEPFTCLKDGETTTVKTDAAAYVGANGGIYVPIRFAAEALGYDFFWVSGLNAMYIVDKTALIAEVDKNMSIINKLLSSSKTDLDTTYESTSKISLKGVLYGDSKDDVLCLDLSANSISKGLNVSMNGKLALDTKDFSDTLLAGSDEETKAILKALENTSFDIIANADNQTMYIKTPLFKFLGRDDIPENAWLQSGYYSNDLLDAYTEEIPSVGAMTYESAFAGLASGYLSYYYFSSPGEDAYDTFRSSAALMNVIMGDSAFTTGVSGSTTTYDLKMDQTVFLARALLYGGNLLDLGLDFSLGSLPKFNVAAQFKETNGVITYTKLEGKIDDISAGSSYASMLPIGVNFKIEGDETKSSGSFSFTGRYVGKIDLTVDSTVKKSDKTVPAAPPSNDTIVSDILPRPIPFEQDEIWDAYSKTLAAIDKALGGF